jgi:hypothetical protein
MVDQGPDSLAAIGHQCCRLLASGHHPESGICSFRRCFTDLALYSPCPRVRFYKLGVGLELGLLLSGFFFVCLVLGGVPLASRHVDLCLGPFLGPDRPAGFVMPSFGLGFLAGLGFFLFSNDPAFVAFISAKHGFSTMSVLGPTFETSVRHEVSFCLFPPDLEKSIYWRIIL